MIAYGQINEMIDYFILQQVKLWLLSPLQLTCTKYKNVKPKGSIKQNYLK